MTSCLWPDIKCIYLKCNSTFSSIRIAEKQIYYAYWCMKLPTEYL